MNFNEKNKQIFIVLIITILNIINKSWRVFPKHYKSMAYVSVINAFYYYLCKRHLVWEFTHKGFNLRLLRVIHIFFVTPLVVLLFLSRLPRRMFNKIVYIGSWTLSFAFFEFIMVKTNILNFKHKWNVFWSGFIYLKMFIFTALYNRNPLLTWGLSFLSTIFYIVIFNVPLTRRLLKGPYFLFTKKTVFPFEFKVD